MYDAVYRICVYASQQCSGRYVSGCLFCTELSIWSVGGRVHTCRIRAANDCVPEGVMQPPATPINEDINLNTNQSSQFKCGGVIAKREKSNILRAINAPCTNRIGDDNRSRTSLDLSKASAEPPLSG